MKRITAIILIILSFTSCEDDPCLKSTGAQMTEVRELSAGITTIDLNNNLSLDIYLDSSNYMIVSGGENVVPFVKSKEEGNTITFTNDNSCGFLRDFDQNIRIELHISDFNILKHNGSNEIIMHDTLHTDAFRFESNDGAGNVQLLINTKNSYIKLGGLAKFQIDGITIDSKIDLEGSGHIQAGNFKSKNAEINHRGTGDCTLRVTGSLSCKIDAIGNLIYYGQPSILVESNEGKGALIFGGL